MEVVMEAESGSLPYPKLVFAVVTDKTQMLELFAAFSFENLPRMSTVSVKCHCQIKDVSSSGDTPGNVKGSHKYNQDREAFF